MVVGAGSGLSSAAGLTYSGERFEKNFADFIAKYHFRDMYSAGFYPFPTSESYWAYWSRHILCNRYDRLPGQPYADPVSYTHLDVYKRQRLPCPAPGH